MGQTRKDEYRQVRVIITPASNGLAVGVIARTGNRGSQTDFIVWRGHVQGDLKLATKRQIVEAAVAVLSHAAEGL